MHRPQRQQVQVIGVGRDEPTPPRHQIVEELRTIDVVGVILHTLDGITQHLIRLGDRPEPIRSVGTGVGVGVQFTGELSVCPLDVVQAGVGSDT